MKYINSKENIMKLFNAIVTKATPSALNIIISDSVNSASKELTIASDVKGVPGQLNKLWNFIKLIDEKAKGEVVILDAAKIPGVFKALREDSKDCKDFNLAFALLGWGLHKLTEECWEVTTPNTTVVFYKGNRPDFDLPTEEESMADYSHEYVPTRWKQIVGDELGQEPSKLPKPVYTIIVYTGGIKLPSVIQLGVVYSEVSVETDQGVKTSKFLYTNTGIITFKGTRFESVEDLVDAVKAAFKVETQEVSETTQQEPEENTMKPKTFCQMMKTEWIPSKDTWEAGNLVARMRATWKSGKYATDDRQAVFMKEFVEQVNILPQGIEMPNSAFLTAYEMVKEKLTGIKTPVEYPETIGEITDEEAVENFEGELPQGNVLSTGTIIPVQGVELPEHLQAFVVKVEEPQEEVSEEEPATDTTAPQYQLGDILAVTYDDEHNEYAYYGGESITVKAIVVEGGFQLGEGEDAEVFATIHELCNKASDGNYEGTPQVRVVTEEEIEAILEKEYNIGMGIE